MMQGTNRTHRTARQAAQHAVRWIAAGLILSVGACSRSGPPAGEDDPYAGGKSYPWSDRLESPGPDPYAGGRAYPWTGVRTASGPLSPQGLNAGDNFLSDLDWTTATNAWGPVERDRSNGEQAGGDGRPITIGGLSFAKGLGVHANSELSYAVSGMCSTFSATIGLDDEVGDRGSVIFQLYSGTQLLYDSGLLRGPDPARPISVDIRGVQNLRLVVRDGGNGINNDHADWGNAQVACPAQPPSGEVYLSDRPWAQAQSAWGPVELDRSNGEQRQADGAPLTLNGVVYPKGLGVHATSVIDYALSGRCTVFSVVEGVDDEVADRGSVVFTIYGDGVKLDESPVMRGPDPGRAVRLDVSRVQTLRLQVGDGNGSITNDHADWADAKITCSSDADTTPPAAPASLSATGDSAGVSLDWADSTEPDLAGYRVSRSSQPGGTYSVLTPTLLTGSAYTDTAAPAGSTSYYQVVAVDQSGNVSAPASASALRPAGVSNGQVSVQNMDGGPWQDRLVFNRIGTLVSPPSNGVHDRVSVRIRNVGSGPLSVSDLPITGAWTLDPAPSLPLSIEAGSFADVRLRFVAEATKLQFGTLTVVSDDPSTPRLPVQLAGLWQSQSENNQEPNIIQIRDAFGYIFSFLGGESNINQKGLVRAQGDEVLSGYWQRADETQPVTIRQLAAYHTQGNTATLAWHPKNSSGGTTIFTHAGIDGQSVLPRLNGSSALSFGSFTPSAQTFGFRIDGVEWSDPRRNSQTADRNNGCPRPCGQHLRFWPVRDRAGVPMPNTYYLIMDYAGINYDYNDNNYIITNIKPAPVLLNVGGPTYTDPGGNTWLSDRDQNGDVPFAPASAIDEGSATSGLAIAGTDNPALYRTYRGNVGSATPRRIVFDIPINNGTYTVKLHFADLAHTSAGQRVFDVMAEGTTRIANLDIVARSGGGKTALVIPLDNVQVSDGKLTLDLTASVDYPSLSGIEILR